MRKKIPWLLAILLFLIARSALNPEQAQTPPPLHPCRIVSLAPAVTETLYALGLGEAVSGVTRFCAWPADVNSKARVSDYSQINLEALARLRPDLAVVPDNRRHLRPLLESMGIPVLELDTGSLPRYLDSVKDLGLRLDRRKESAALLSAFRAAFGQEEKAARGLGERPRVLFSVMRGEGPISELHIVGGQGFYNDVLVMAGGRNAYGGPLSFPLVSREAVVALDPDVVIDVVPHGSDAEAARRAWQDFPIRAIREGRLLLLSDTDDTVPGPRSRLTLQRISRFLYPELSLFPRHDEQGEDR